MPPTQIVLQLPVTAPPSPATKTIRVFDYWAQPASAADNQQLQQQMQLAYRYRRHLANIENAARAVQCMLDTADPAIAAGIATLQAVNLADAITAGINPADPQAMRKWRETKTDSPAAAAARKVLQAARKTLHQDLAYKAEVKLIGDRRALLVRSARALYAQPGASQPGLAWGTYQFVEEAHDQSCGEIPYWEEVHTHTPPGHGVIAVHIQGRTVPTSTLIGGDDTFLRVGATLYGLGPAVQGFRPVRPANLPRTKSGGGAPRLQSVRLRTGSAGPGGRTPIWTEFHMLMHRPLPPGKVLWARVHQIRIGIRSRWSVQFVVDVEGGLTTLQQPAKGGAAAKHVGIDIGWRKLDTGWRVALAYGNDGFTHELVVPNDVLQRAKKSQDLRSIRDKTRDREKAALQLFRTTATDPWFLTATASLHMWLKIGRYVRLRREWDQQRFAGDQVAYTALAAWLDNDRHLIDWQEFNVRRMKNQIEGRYVAWAHMIAQRYGVVGIEDMNLTDVKAAIAARQGPLSKLAHQRGMVVGVGLLTDSLTKAVSKYQTQLIENDPAYTTRNCSACGFCRPSSADLIITCPACGVSEDQDLTAAKNLLTATSAAVAALSGGPLAGGSGGSGPAIPVKPRMRRTRKKPKAPPLATP